MKVSELITELRHMQRQHGDKDVLLDVWCHGLLSIDEVGVDAEDTGIIVWGTPVERDGVTE